MATDSAKTGLANRSTGSIGACSVAWRRTNTTPTPTAASISPTATPRGWSPPKPSSPVMNSPNVAAFSTAPGRSKRWRARGEPGSAPNSAIASSPIGTLTANSHGQSATERIAAATVGPSAEEVATISAFTPMPRPSMACGKMVRISAVLTLISPAAPSPWNTRASVSSGRLGASAQAREAAVNITSPQKYTRR